MDVDDIDIIDSVPSFAINRVTNKPADVKGFLGLTRYLREFKPQVAIFDPLYWALGGASVGDMYEIGTVLRTISELCVDHGAWPVFCHHGRKGNMDDDGRPMQLGDLYGAGAQQFARQWLLVSHSEPFKNGRANLWLNMGGSATRDRGLWRLNIDEGQSDEIIDGTWDLHIERVEQDSISVSSDAVVNAIGLTDVGKGVTIQEIQFRTNAKTPGEVEAVVRSLMDQDRVEMKPGKRFSLLGDVE
jgi:hypothetical protein